ncbi:MarR family transcriptional regulator [Candidatus Woesearchaeota archaeon]|nr:MarR family transcriptional regulator [Candidatus Woesearchaeota archaeon]
MDNKKLGIIIVVIGIILISIVTGMKIKEDIMINKIIEQQGSCYLEDGTCLHDDRDFTLYIAGWIFSAIVIALGIFLIFFERSQKEIVSALSKQKEMKIEEEKFEILLKGLNEDEKKILKAVKEQDGITQQTLRLRTDLHKSKLSILLDNLEKKGLIARETKGKTKEVHLKMHF